MANWTRRRKVVLTVLVAAAVAWSATAAWGRYKEGPPIPPEVMAKFKQYDSPYYTVYSDLEAAKVQLAIARMTSVAQLYNERTKSFGQIKGKFQLYIIGDPQLYKAAGGEAWGVTFSDRLMGRADRPAELWHVVQHEAWHQFAHKAISEQLPGWIDEGTAEYFGESLWTGDGLVCGVLPKARYDRIMPRLRDGTIKPFKEIILIKASAWAGIKDYDQGMTMIHFCIHAENGKYQKALNACMKSTIGGATFEQAFATGFGCSPEALQKAYLAWWATVSRESVVERPYAKAAVATLASFLGRAWSQGQKFETAEEFLKAAGDGSLKKSQKQALPDELLKEAVDRAAKLKDWSFEQAVKPALPKLVLKQADGTIFTATVILKQNLVDKVTVDVKEPATSPSTATPAAPKADK